MLDKAMVDKTKAAELEAARRSVAPATSQVSRGIGRNKEQIALLNPKKIVARFGFHSTGSPEPLEQIDKLENLIGVPLPRDYRQFLLEVGGGNLNDVVVPCTVPTPFGRHNMTRLHSVEEVVGLLNSGKAPRNMICIGFGHFGLTTCLSVAGIDHGHIFSLDTEMRFFWDQKTIRKYPDLDPTIREFFRLRDTDKLPSRPWGYENCYHVADSFTMFLSKMKLATAE